MMLERMEMSQAARKRGHSLMRDHNGSGLRLTLGRLFSTKAKGDREERREG